MQRPAEAEALALLETQPPAPHLEIDQVSLAYATRRGSTLALQGLGFTIGRGEFVSVLGPSGCGKSTLLRLVSGLLPPSEGRLRLKGQRIVGPDPRVGIVFQQPTLLPWKTALENVLAPMRALGRPAQQYRARALALLDLVGLRDFADHYPHELSGGMQQRVGIARGLVHEPELLLMDEPLAALDAMTREYMMVELQKIWMATGTSVLFITHSIPEAVFLSDRVVVMTPRPGSVRTIVTVDIPRPRTLDTLALPRFTELSAHLRSLFAPGAAA